MVTPAATTAIADLRHTRKDLRREIARVRWWRRLIASRHDLTVAHLAQATTREQDLETTWDALAVDAPRSSEIAAAIWPETSGLTSSALQRLEDLDARLGSYESRLSANLDGVTRQLVTAMGDAR